MLRDVKVTIEAATEEQLALLLVEDDEVMLTLVLGPSDVALPIVVNVEVLLLVCCGTVSLSTTNDVDAICAVTPIVTVASIISIRTINTVFPTFSV